MSSSLKAFFDALNRAEAGFRTSLAGDNLGIYLRGAINEMDWFYYNASNGGSGSDESQEQFYILMLGTTRLIHLALCARESFDAPVITFLRRRERSLQILELVSGLGMIQHGRRVAQTVACGVGNLQEASPNRFVITLPAELYDDDYRDRAVVEHFHAQSRQHLRTMLDDAKPGEWHAAVDRILGELVYPFAEHYIGYGADPLLDEYFFLLAYHEIRLQPGFDTYAYSTRFGGISVQNYVLALTFLIAITARHVRFAEALVRKKSGVRLENLLTISSETEGLAQGVRDAVNRFGPSFEGFEPLDLDGARSIVEVLSCSRRSTALTSAPGAPLPPLVKTSDRGLIRSVTGAQTEPMRFLHESLRFHFPKDYALNQQARESSMQRAIQRVLDEAVDGLEYRQNIVVKQAGQSLTDIDLVILEPRTGIALLCQLKHQELFGADLHAKRSRGDRLKREARAWLTAIDRWLTGLDESELRTILRLPRTYPAPSVYRLVVSRHHSAPLREVVDPSVTCFATWEQFYNACLRMTHETDTAEIRTLLAILRDTQYRGGRIEHQPEPSREWAVNGLQFITRQEGELAR